MAQGPKMVCKLLFLPSAYCAFTSLFSSLCIPEEKGKKSALKSQGSQQTLWAFGQMRPKALLVVLAENKEQGCPPHRGTMAGPNVARGLVRLSNASSKPEGGGAGERWDRQMAPTENGQKEDGRPKVFHLTLTSFAWREGEGGERERGRGRGRAGKRKKV